MDELLEGLNSEQRRAVEYGAGPMLVVAGAGTGKTQVITRRIARLIAAKEAKPTEILALTFTEKAAQEMSDRLLGLIGWEAMSVPVRTFNAFGAELIMNFSHHVGRSIRGGLINDTQKSLLLKQRITDIPLEYYGLQQDLYDFAERIVAYIGRLQNLGLSAVAYRTFVDGLRPDPEHYSAGDIAEQLDLAALYEAYEQVKRDTQTYDYYDQLALPLAILEARPNLVDRLQQRYRFILVDEYQDTSPVQDALLRLLVPPGGNIFAVGDDDQAIYAFRGAELRNIMAFRDHFKVSEPLALIENYRSGQPILDAAYRLIAHNNPERLEAMLGIDKHLHAQTSEATVAYRLYRTAADEELMVVEELRRRLEGGEEASTIAVLARSNGVLRRFAKLLRERKLPYTISTTISVFEQREMINLWSLMEWICHRASDEAIGAVIMGPFIGWPAGALRRVVERSRSEVLSFEGALRLVAEDGDEAADRLVALLDEWRDLAGSETVSRLVYRLVFEYGLAERLQARGADPRTIRVFDDLRRFLEQLQDYEATQLLLAIGDLGAVTYLSQFPKPPELETTETEGDAAGISLLTVHASKGLEYPTVYLVGVTARSWGVQGSMGLEPPEELRPVQADLADVYEQRRLMYVAVTRAKTELYVSASTQTSGGTTQAVSPMLAELAGDTPLETVAPTEDSTSNSLLKLQRFYPLQSQLPDTLPFERDDGWIELGVGDLERFSEHPHDFYLQNVLGILRPFGPQLSFGTAVHGAIQAFYEARLQGEVLSDDEVSTRLDELWSDRGYESEAQARAAHERAYATLRAFRARELADPQAVEATELPIQFEVPEAKLRLRGRIDATMRRIDGIEIRDFKTGGVKDPEKLLEKTKKSFQLRTYALAMQELTGTAPVLVTLDYVVTGTCTSTALTPRVLANHRAKLIELAASLRRREFDPGAPSAFNSAAAFRFYGTESGEDEITEELT